MDIKAEIQKLAKEIGISKIGFTTADNFDYLEKSLRASVEEGRNSGFEHKVIEDRIYPERLLESVKRLFQLALLILTNFLSNLKKHLINEEKLHLIRGGLIIIMWSAKS